MAMEHGVFFAASVAYGIAALALVEGPGSNITGRRRLEFASAYGGALLLVAVLRGVAALFVAGMGHPSLPGEVALTVAIVFYALSGASAIRLFGRRRLPFFYWYGLGLFVTASGCAGLLVDGPLAGPLGSAGKISLHLGTVYLLAAFGSAFRHTRGADPRAEVPTPFIGESEVHYRRLVETARDAIIGTDSEGRVVLWNPAAEAIFGFSSHEAVGFLLTGLVGFDIVTLNRLRSIGSAENLPEQVRTTLRRKDGSRLSCEVSASATETDEKSLTLIIRDITARLRSEQALRRYELLAEHVRDIILFIRIGDGRLVEANASAVRAYGYSREELLNKTVHDLRAPETHGLTASQIAEAEETGILFEAIHMRKDGTTFPVEVSSKGASITGARMLISVVRDVTERRQAEAALRRSEAQYRLVAENMADVVWTADLPSGRFTYASPSVRKLRGFTPEQAMEQSIKEALTPESFRTVTERLPARLAALAKGDESARVRTHQVEEVCKDGAIVPTEVVTTLLTDEKGEVTAVLGISRDATERRWAEAALRESEEHYRSLFDNMLNGFAYCWMIFEEDRPVDFIYLSVNQAFTTLTGLTNVVGRKASEVIPGIQEKDPGLLEAYGRVASSGTAERFEIRLESLAMWFAVSVYSPKRGYFMAVFEVITERKLAEAALKESEERFRAVVESAPDAIFIQTEGAFTYLNQAALTLFGVETVEQLEGLPVVDRFHPDFRPAVRDRIRLLNEERMHMPLVEETVLREDGSEVHAEVSAVPFTYRNRQGALVFIRDASERKKAETKLRESLDEKVVLLKEVHHRVKNNLQIVASLLNLQAKRLTDRDAADVLNETRNRVHSMALLHEVLYRSGNLAYINFFSYVEELLRHLKRSVGPVARRVKVANRCARINLPLEQSVPCGLIINELVSNAFKHAFPGERSGTVTVEIGPAGDGRLLLSVGDDGAGMPPGRDIASFSTLGLQVASNLAGQLGGRLTMEAGGLEGTSFRVIFPVPDNTLLEGEA